MKTALFITTIVALAVAAPTALQEAVKEAAREVVVKEATVKQVVVKEAVKTVKEEEETVNEEEEEAEKEAVVKEAVKEKTPEPIKILVDKRTQPEGGSYSFTVETANGILQREVGTPGVAGQTNVEGYYRYPLENGTVAEVRYVANELGFQVDTPLMPISPEFPYPIPQYVLDQIKFAEEERRLQDLRLEQEAKELEEAKLLEAKERQESKERQEEVEQKPEGETQAVVVNEKKQ